MTNQRNSTFRLVITTPVYDDWESFNILLEELKIVADLNEITIHVVAIDDGSVRQSQFSVNQHSDRTSLEIIQLACNLGHQRAIAIGLAYINENISCDAVIVMDSDGEDRPEDIPRLLECHWQQPAEIIFARRSRRSEGLVFRFFYAAYRTIFRLFTGEEIAFGNFSLIPLRLLGRVVYLPAIWNHYTAGIMRANLAWQSIPTQRGKRYGGVSKMNFVGLVLHGLSAMSVYLDILTVRLMFAVLSVIVLGLIGFGIMLYFRFLTPLAIPGWATNVAIGLSIILFQAMLFLTLLTFLVLNYRSAKLFIPAKDYRDYLMNVDGAR